MANWNKLVNLKVLRETLQNFANSFSSAISGKMDALTNSIEPIEVAETFDAVDDKPLKNIQIQFDIDQITNGYGFPWTHGSYVNLCPHNYIGQRAFWETNNNVMVNFLNTLPAGDYAISHKCIIYNTGSLSTVRYEGPDIQVNGTSIVTERQISSDSSPEYDKCYTVYSLFTIGDNDVGNITSCYFYFGDPTPGTFSGRITNVQVEEGTEATDYTPYYNRCDLISYGWGEVRSTGKNLIPPSIHLYIGFRITPENKLSLSSLYNIVSVHVPKYTDICFSKSNTTNTCYLCLADRPPFDGEKCYEVTDASNMTEVTFFTEEQRYLYIVIPSSLNINNFDSYYGTPCVNIGPDPYRVSREFENVASLEWYETPGQIYGGTYDGDTGTLYSNNMEITLTGDETFYTDPNDTYVKEDACDAYIIVEGMEEIETYDTELYAKCNFLQAAYADSIWNTDGYVDQFAIEGDRIHLNISNRALGITDYTQETNESAAAKIKAYIKMLYDENIPMQIVVPKDDWDEYNVGTIDVRTHDGYNAIWVENGLISFNYNVDLDKHIEELNDRVKDVQIDGTSIVEDGIADIPYATNSVAGIAKADSYYGIYVNNQKLTVNSADSGLIKQGTHEYRPITPIRQHNATFYGLAKAAGDTTQATSNNAVGVYTSEAKAAIQSMIGVDPGVVFVETVSGTTPVITAEPNVRYICGEVTSISITPPVTGTIIVKFTSGTTPAVLTIPNTIKWPAWVDLTTLEASTVYEIMVTDGEYGGVMTWPV